MKKEYKKISLNLDKEIHSALEKLAREKYTNKSTLINQILADFFCQGDNS